MLSVCPTPGTPVGISADVTLGIRETARSALGEVSIDIIFNILTINLVKKICAYEGNRTRDQNCFRILNDSENPFILRSN